MHGVCMCVRVHVFVRAGKYMDMHRVFVILPTISYTDHNYNTKQLSS